MATQPQQPSKPASSPPRQRHQRIDGAARLRFGPSGITDLYQRAPCRFLCPAQVHSGFPEAVSITTSGGLTGGDKIALDLGVEADGRATITTQAAEKLYRVLPGEADISMSTTINVGENGRCEWLAQEAILFNKSRLRRTLDIQLAPGAKLLAAESLVLGRSAMGEIFSEGAIHDAWRVWRGGDMIWADAFRLDGDIKAQSASPFHLGGAVALGTIVYAGEDAQAHLPLARTLMAGMGGASCLTGLLILRFLHRDAQMMRKGVAASLGALRAAIFGLPRPLPAVWSC